VIEGDYARRKFWSLMLVEGETEGQKQAADISRKCLRAILESAGGIDPVDESEQAISARSVNGYADLDGLRFWAVVGVKKGKNGYKDKNVLSGGVTPDRKGWTKLEQTVATPKPPTSVPATGVTKAAGRPSWAG
jgi:hypothetical protein